MHVLTTRTGWLLHPPGCASVMHGVMYIYIYIYIIYVLACLGVQPYVAATTWSSTSKLRPLPCSLPPHLTSKTDALAHPALPCLPRAPPPGQRLPTSGRFIQHLMQLASTILCKCLYCQSQYMHFASAPAPPPGLNPWAPLPAPSNHPHPTTGPDRHRHHAPLPGRWAPLQRWHCFGGVPYAQHGLRRGRGEVPVKGLRDMRATHVHAHVGAAGRTWVCMRAERMRCPSPPHTPPLVFYSPPRPACSPSNPPSWPGHCLRRGRA